MSREQPTRAQRRTLRREVTAFPAILPSRYPDIAFSARITATTYPVHIPGHDHSALARLVRGTLRRAAADVASQLHPADLPGAQDALADNLAGPRPMAGHPGHDLGAGITITLDSGAAAATDRLVQACRQQQLEDTVFLQAARARARALADPAVLGAALTMPAAGPWADLVKDFKLTDKGVREELFGALTHLSQFLATVRAPSHDPSDRQVLEIMRTFFSRFEHTHQRRFLISFTSRYLRAVGQPDLADQLEGSVEVSADMSGDEAPEAVR
ncbi:hypothetical protein ACFYST_23695 [Kitasatospora sp. NPDC004614]|uniref:hypothetical protein n=1 Tax=unclassified Kitasatospora TaxID=2633591 RepID=UPI0036B96B43